MWSRGAFVICVLTAGLPAQPAPLAVSHADLVAGRAVIVGALRVPLGTIVTADVEIVSVPVKLLFKVDGAYYRLRCTP